MSRPYVLIGETRYENEPDIVFDTDIYDIEDARKKAVSILKSERYKNRFVCVTIFRNNICRGIVVKTGPTYSFCYKGTISKIRRNGSIRIY